VSRIVRLGASTRNSSMVSVSLPASLAAAGNPARTESASGRSKKRGPGARRRSGVACRKPASFSRPATAWAEATERRPSRRAMCEKEGRLRCAAK
jgi:hypothetical protein